MPQQSTDLPTDPSAFIQKLYGDVLRYHPYGVLYIPAQRKRFLPYLSEELRHRIALNDACLRDWFRQHRGQVVKPPGLEGGIFSGMEEREWPERFYLQEIQKPPDGSIHVIVTLSGRLGTQKWYTWPVEVVLTHNGSRLGVSDVIYLPDTEVPSGEGRLTEDLSYGCQGPHWVGLSPTH